MCVCGIRISGWETHFGQSPKAASDLNNKLSFPAIWGLPSFPFSSLAVAEDKIKKKIYWSEVLTQNMVEISES